MKKRFFLLLIILTQNLFCTSLSYPLLEPKFTLQEIFEQQQLSSIEIITSSIEFSEEDISSVLGQSIITKYLELEKTVTSNEFLKLPEEERGKLILKLMYDNVLIKYAENQTKITTMFTNGTYNCVSSSILYLALAKAAKLNVVAQKAPLHAFCSIYINNKKIDVETTNPYGFDPGKKVVIKSTKNQTQYAVIPQKKYNNRQEITDKNLIGLIASNLCGLYIKQNNYQKAIPLAISRLNFLQTENPLVLNQIRNDLDILISNYTILLEKNNDYNSSLDFFFNFINKFGTTTQIADSYSKSTYNAVAFYLNNKDLETSKNIFNKHKDYILSSYKERISEMLFIEELEFNLEKLSANQALQLLEQIQTNELTEQNSKRRIDYLKDFFWTELINQEVSKENFIQAATLCDQAISKTNNSSLFTKIKQQCLKNHAIITYNKAVPLINNKRYNEAINILQEGLKENPTSIELKQDILKVQRFLEAN